jgi:purine-binding chemotaxis protein CheW
MKPTAAATEGGSKIVQLATFRVGQQQYAIDIMRVREIINLQPITSVPSSVEIIEGVINLRGVIIPVVDLRKRLGGGKEQGPARPKIIIVLIEKQLLGIIVDEVLEVVRIPRSLIRPALHSMLQKEADLVLGVFEHHERLLLLLNLNQLLRPALKQRPSESAE